MRVILLTALLATAVSAQQPSRLDQTLRRLDASSAKFVGAEAHIHRDLFDKLINDFDARQDGTIYFLRPHGAPVRMGLKIAGQGPNNTGASTVEYNNGSVRILTGAKANCYNTYSAAGSQAKIDSVLTLGFGGSGKDLERQWTVEDLGEESVDGVKVEKLNLVPKDAAVKGITSHATIWIDLDRDVSLKQISYAPNGDTDTATYTAIKLTPRPDTKPYEIHANPCK